MSIPKEPMPAKLMTAVLFAPDLDQELFLSRLGKAFGDIDFVSEPILFSHSKYYEPEMGEGLLKRFITYAVLRKQDELISIKLLANEIEKEFSVDTRRKLNVDPGILTLERLVLATGKNYTHRIYLGRGIFADLTLIYQKGTYRPLPWTYPDYTEPLVIQWMNGCRAKYLEQLRLGARKKKN